MKIFSNIFYSIIVLVSFMWYSIFSVELIFAQWDPENTPKPSVPEYLKLNVTKADGFIEVPIDRGDGIVTFLGFIQTLLLELVLPLVAIGCGLYIAYVLFTAEWDEAKMKKVWRAVAYSIIGIISIMLAYLVVDIISRLNLA